MSKGNSCGTTKVKGYDTETLLPQFCVDALKSALGTVKG